MTSPIPPRRWAVALGLSATLLLPACTGGSGSGPFGGDGPVDDSAGSYRDLPDELARQELAWRDCGPPTPAQGALGGAPEDLPDGTPWECATLTVPLDYEAPDGETIGIALIRARAAGGGERERIGSLVFNFGGPGGSGVATLPSYGEDFAELRAAYDLVSFDPRGVGESAPVICEDDALKDAEGQDPAGPPATPAEEREALADHHEYVAACEREAGELLPHLTTTNTARDLDLLRHVLGDDRLNYMGFSYGTELGAVYAHLFPGTVGGMVLDSVVDPTGDAVEQALLQTEGFQSALDTYLADCAAQAAENAQDCPFLADGGDGGALIAGLLDQIEAQPLPTTQDAAGRELTYGLAVTAIGAALYSEETWEYLTLGLSEAMGLGTGDILLSMADVYNGRDGEGRYSNQDDAGAAIRCADATGSRLAVEEVRAHADAFEDASPVFGESLVWGLAGCLDWPVPGESANPVVSAGDAAAPILLVATTGDPATPYAGAARMQEAMGGPDVAPLLTLDGEGHGAYTAGNACVVDAVNAHLLDGDVPEDGQTC